MITTSRMRRQRRDSITLLLDGTEIKGVHPVLVSITTVQGSRPSTREPTEEQCFEIPLFQQWQS